jgi:hypothetical protein
MSDGFGNKASSGTWCRLAGGKVIRVVTPDTPGAIKVAKKNKDGSAQTDESGQTLYSYQLQNDTVSGCIVKLSNKTQEYGGAEITNLIVTLKTNSGHMINVQMKQGDRYWMGFANTLSNIDLTKEVSLEPYDYIARTDGKRKQGIGIKQGGEQVPWKFKKDTPGGPPQLETVKAGNGKDLVMNGKIVYDWSPIIEFYCDIIMQRNVELAAIVGIDSHEEEAQGYPEAGSITEVEPDEEDLLPF